MPGLLASVADGLLLGFVYGVAAMGLTLIWGVMEVINLSHGATMALGMFTTYLLFTGLGLNPYLALLVVAVLGLAFGFLVYGVAVHRVIGAPHLSSLLATFAVEMIIIGVGTAILTTSLRNIDLTLGSMQISPLLSALSVYPLFAALLLIGSILVCSLLVVRPFRLPYYGTF